MYDFSFHCDNSSKLNGNDWHKRSNYIFHVPVCEHIHNIPMKTRMFCVLECIYSHLRRCERERNELMAGNRGYIKEISIVLCLKGDSDDIDIYAQFCCCAGCTLCTSSSWMFRIYNNSILIIALFIIFSDLC